MTASYRILKYAKLKHVLIEGSTNYKELEGLFFKYVRDAEFTPDLRILADLRGMTDAIAGLWEIRKLKELYQNAYNDAIGVVDVAIVVNEGVAYRAARAFQLFMRDKKPLRISITDDLSKARDILKIDYGVIAQLYAGKPLSGTIPFPLHRRLDTCAKKLL